MSEAKMAKRMPVKVIKVLGKILMILIISQVCYSSLPVALVTLVALVIHFRIALSHSARSCLLFL